MKVVLAFILLLSFISSVRYKLKTPFSGVFLRSYGRSHLLFSVQLIYSPKYFSLKVYFFVFPSVQTGALAVQQSRQLI